MMLHKGPFGSLGSVSCILTRDNLSFIDCRGMCAISHYGFEYSVVPRGALESSSRCEG